MFPQDVLNKIVAYQRKHNYPVFEGPGRLNSVWVEGMNLDGTLNADRLDDWNDLCIVYELRDGVPICRHAAVGTTEPGRSATLSAAARKRGGVARITFGPHKAWQFGFHKGDPNHPALVQRAPILVHRDSNLDGLRTGDPIRRATGINQHSTMNAPRKVGRNSEGCLVHLLMRFHLAYLALLRTDYDYINSDGQPHLFTSTILPGNEL